MRAPDSADVSRTFAIAKVLSIIVVATAHYLPGTVLWVPQTVGLFVFAFSSGFFTGRKYAGRFSLGRFWRAKVDRLAVRLLVIDACLLILFLAQGRPGIVRWQTLPSLVGLSGFLTWFKVPSPSPFGAGLWFFTLLWLFYGAYPLLNRATARPGPAAVTLAVALAACSILHVHLKVGHMLWLTAFAFVFGVYSARHSLRVRPVIPAVLAVGLAGVMVLLNVKWDWTQANYWLILLVSVATVYFLMQGPLRGRAFAWLLVFSGCVMELYFVHTYVFIDSDRLHPAVGATLSLLLAIASAFLLGLLGRGARSLLRRGPRTVAA